MGSTFVDYRTQSGIAIITLNDAPMNAYTHEMMRELDDAIVDARFDNDVHVIVLTGHGDRYFCGGVNLQMLTQVDSSFRYYFTLHANETLLRIEQTPKLVIAAINGHAVAGGFEIALACDLRVARQGAGRVGFPEVNSGLLPSLGGIQRMARHLGRGQLLQLLVEGTQLEFEQAESLGLLHHVWEAETSDGFLERVLEFARRFLPSSKAVCAVSAIKRSIGSGTEMPLESALAFGRELEAQLWATADAHEGVDASLAKRRPIFKGR